MEKPKVRLILDLAADISEELEKTACVGGVSRQEVIRMILDSARPHLGDLAKVLKAAKDQQGEALEHVLLGMAGKASIQAGQMTLGISAIRERGKKRGTKST